MGWSLKGQHEANIGGRRHGLTGRWPGPLVVASVLCMVLTLGPLCWGQLIGSDRGNSVKHLLHHQHDSGPEAMEIIKARGFIGEQYALTSRDGAPLAIYHIINPLADQRTLNRYPVLYFHGVTGDAAQMLSHSDLTKPRRPVLGQVTYDLSDTSLPFMLANNNFDVYMADARGSNLNNHRVADDFNLLMGQKFWNFSLDEHILNDLPTFIDFVLDQTHEDKLHYVGYSQSTLFMFCLMAAIPAYQARLASVITMAPVAYLNGAQGITLPGFLPSALIPEQINGNFVPQMFIDTGGTVLREMCQFEPITRTLCLGASSAFSGSGTNELSKSFYAANFKGVSIKTARHFIQIFLHKRLGMYDYGTDGNLRQYGQPTPPRYDLSKIKFPFLIIFRGGKDLVSDPVDQEQLIRELGVKPYLDFNFPNYNHIDFIISRNIIFDVNLPATKAMFHLLKLQSYPPGSYLRHPAKALMPKRLKPAQTVVPDGTRTLKIKSNLMNDMINTFTQSMTGDVLDPGVGITAGAVSLSPLKQPLAMPLM